MNALSAVESLYGEGCEACPTVLEECILAPKYPVLREVLTPNHGGYVPLTMEAGNEGVRLSPHSEKALKFGRHILQRPLHVYDLLKEYTTFLLLWKVFPLGLILFINNCCLLLLKSFESCRVFTCALTQPPAHPTPC